ncbi:hypothetical protein LTR99_004074 [Exophiala xenobiotica]|uniref:BZIP domain-containing protein n=1 Tax=Vermiconidia calcicola TaxID=1690605 RepID=A0AAV9QJT9_9PEZI|nr:hypothetical protein LTR99_004074 [Exophiala xenobiotica]KAK5435543.1 hypothetical protein LTR34_003047 [Exophiala xenobiotica]KAK5545164.1 hypothetical protein LTR25_000171 [Vermiconidia calcicola]KAK5549190.1 hypothetical protein LTR23_001020 [Chaetothyriales sp. CCFEE 6169]
METTSEVSRYKHMNMTGHDVLSPSERSYEKKLAAVPEWYFVARSARPQLSQHADTLLYGPSNGERGFRKQIPDVDAQRWVEVERQISDQMPTEFDALVTLQKHVNAFTACDPNVIAGLFAGRETEEERLAVVLGSHVKFPDTKFPRSLGMEPSVGESTSLLTRGQVETADGEDNGAYDSDESVLFYGPEEAEADQKRRRTEKNRRHNRRYRENLRKRKEDLAAEATTQAKKQLDGRHTRQPKEDPAPEAKTQAKKRLRSRSARQPNELPGQTDRARSKRSQAPEPEPTGQANRSASQRGEFRRSSRDAKETPRNRGYMERDTTGLWRRIPT